MVCFANRLMMPECLTSFELTLNGLFICGSDHLPNTGTEWLRWHKAASFA
jgi:hypothetical protein